ncbi:MAG: acylphosphatase [Rhodospirillales bacterium]|nr:acylphosphatase [Rhodospirillales bacterium]
MVDSASAKAVQVRIEGRVQGVWFRAWTAEQAKSRGLRGWVRNCRDGSVEAVFAGTPGAVDDMVRICWRGPPLAEVRKLTAGDAEDPGGTEFGQRPTA